MNKKGIILSILLLAFGASAFSPYENYLQSGRPTHVMLMATAREGKSAELIQSLQALDKKRSARKLAKQQITNLAIFSRTLGEKACVFVYFDYSGKKDYLRAVEDFESVEAVKALQQWVSPVPPAADRGHHWLQLEWMNYIHGSWNDAPATNRVAMVTRIKPEKEEEYRWLHQTTWPAVVDWMNRYGWRNFSIFLTQLNGTIYEFYYVEEVPSEHLAKNLGKDPTLARWLKLTDPCQNPLPDADGIWAPMKCLMR